MAGGGARPGAGRKPGGVTDARRRLVAGMERGLARAARIAGCHAETEEELVVEAVSRVAEQMVAAGQGADVLKLYSAMAYSGPANGSDDDGETPLERAMRRLPGLAGGTDPAPHLIEGRETAARSDTYRHGTTDKVSDGPGNRPPPKPLGPVQVSMIDGLTGELITSGAGR